MYLVASVCVDLLDTNRFYISIVIFGRKIVRSNEWAVILNIFQKHQKEKQVEKKHNTG